MKRVILFSIAENAPFMLFFFYDIFLKAKFWIFSMNLQQYLVLKFCIWFSIRLRQIGHSFWTEKKLFSFSLTWTIKHWKDSHDRNIAHGGVFMANRIYLFIIVMSPKCSKKRSHIYRNTYRRENLRSEKINLLTIFEMDFSLQCAHQSMFVYVYRVRCVVGYFFLSFNCGMNAIWKEKRIHEMCHCHAELLSAKRARERCKTQINNKLINRRETVRSFMYN